MEIRVTDDHCSSHMSGAAWTIKERRNVLCSVNSSITDSILPVSVVLGRGHCCSLVLYLYINRLGVKYHPGPWLGSGVIPHPQHIPTAYPFWVGALQVIAWPPRLISRSPVLHSWEIPIMRHPGAFPHFPSPSTSPLGGLPSVGTASPRPSPFQIPVPGVPPFKIG